MQEDLLRKFFEGQATVAELAKDIERSTKHYTSLVTVHSIQPMDADFTVTRTMLVALCDAVLEGALPAQALGDIGFVLVESDHFIWNAEEDELLGDVVYDWYSPATSYPLNSENVLRFRSWLMNETPYPDK